MELTPTATLTQIRVGLPSGEGVWFSPQKGLNFLYGKNGSGKSTVIEALSNVFVYSHDFRKKTERDRSKKHSAVTAYFEVHSVWFTDILDSILLEFTQFLAERDIHIPEVLSELSFRTVSLLDDLEERANYDHWLRFAGSVMPEDLRHLNVADLFDEWRTSIREATSDSQVEEGDVEHLRSFNDVLEVARDGFRDLLVKDNIEVFALTAGCRVLFRQLKQGLVRAFTGSYSEITVEYANEVFERFGLQTRLEDTALTDRSFDVLSWSELLEIYLAKIAISFEETLKTTAESWDMEDSVEVPEMTLAEAAPSSYGVAKAVLVAFEEQMDSPTFWIEHGYDEFRRMGLALGRQHERILDGESSISLDGLCQQVRDQVAQILNDTENDSTNENWSALIHFASDNEILRFSPSTREFGSYIEKYRSVLENERYIDLENHVGMLSDQSPIQGIRLDQDVDLDIIAQKVFTDLVSSGLRSATFELVDDDLPTDRLEFNELNFSPINRFVSNVSSFLASLDIGILECKFDYPRSVSELAARKEAEFRFCVDSEKPAGIAKSKLSSGQQYWVNAAFQICYAEQMNQKYLLLADEPERGLHQRAVLSAFNSLGNLSATSIVSTHSVAALGLAGVHLLHLDRGFDGQIQVTEPYLGEDVIAAANRFGTTTFDLLAIKRALVVVEGAHDVEVVKGLAGLVANGKLVDRLIIVPARGVKNVATVADSAIITEFTNLHILAITDNGRSEVLQGALNRGIEALSQGKSPTHAVVATGISELTRDASPEERYMFDLIERAIHRRVVNRLHIFPIEAPDIVDLLPEKSFGLSKSWTVLRSEHRRNGTRESFKAWLKAEYGVSISSKSVKRAFDSLDTVEGELRRILDELEIVASLSPFEG